MIIPSISIKSVKENYAVSPNLKAAKKRYRCYDPHIAQINKENHHDALPYQFPSSDA